MEDLTFGIPDIPEIDNKMYSPFMQEFESKRRNVYFDEDMEQLKKLFRMMRKVFETMESRWNRHSTLQIAKSVFDYCTQREDYYRFPQHYFDFRSGDTRICIGREKHEYFVHSNYIPSEYVKAHFTNAKGYGSFESPDKAVELFYNIVYDFILARNNSLL